MKSPTIFRNKYVLLLAVALCILTSCKKDQVFDVNGDETNRVFFNVENYTVKNYNSFAFFVKQTPTGSVANDIKAEFPVRLTQQAVQEIKVSYAVDNSLISAYNSQNKTNYVALPAGVAEWSTAQLTIAQGATLSTDVLKFSVAKEKLPQLTAAGYVVPVKITSVNGAKNTEVSSNASIVYVVITTVQSNVYDSPIVTDMTGTINTAARPTWSATLDAALTSGTLANLFDTSTSTSWYVSPAKAVTLTVDMAAARSNITGIRFHTSTTTYALTTANVWTSIDGLTWVSQGTANFSVVNAYQYIKFYSAVNARYVKLDITGWRSGSTRIMMTDFNIYQ